jgi:putative Mg2+ transporter-C (MgtC) family protein
MIPLSEIAVRLAVATVLAGIVGMERERSERAAGLRTHAMVGLGAALFMVLSMHGFGDVLGAPNVVLDPSRMAAQIVSGIGFLGAGMIVLQREMVRGLTTAASVWVVAAIGAAAGSGMYLAAVGTTALALVVLAALLPLEKRFFGQRRTRELSLVVDRGAGSLAAIESAVESAGQRMNRLVVVPGPRGEVDRIDIILGPTPTRDLSALVDNLRRLEGVRQISSTR